MVHISIGRFRELEMLNFYFRLSRTVAFRREALRSYYNKHWNIATRASISILQFYDTRYNVYVFERYTLSISMVFKYIIEIIILSNFIYTFNQIFAINFPNVILYVSYIICNTN